MMTNDSIGVDISKDFLDAHRLSDGDTACFQGNRDGFFDYCEAAGPGSQFYAELAAQGVDISAIKQGRYEASYKDPRVSRLAAIDRGLTWDLE